MGYNAHSIVHSKSSIPKLNVKSSTEGEIVGVSDFLPNMIWARMFLQEQGYTLKNNTLYQDNQSAMKIILNGRRSSGSKTKHMDNRYFWIKDRLESEGIEVKYCPTANMIADFFTKPLQGMAFKKLRDVVQGYKHVSTLMENDEDLSVEERVRKGSILTDEENVGAPEKDPVIKDTGNYDQTQVIKDWKKQYDEYSTTDVIKEQKVSWGQMVDKIEKKGKG